MIIRDLQSLFIQHLNVDDKCDPCADTHRQYGDSYSVHIVLSTINTQMFHLIINLNDTNELLEGQIVPTGLHIS
jgi:hypothetical protein